MNFVKRFVARCKNFLFRFYRVALVPRSADEDTRRREYVLNFILAGSIVMLLILQIIMIRGQFYRPSGDRASVSAPEFSVILLFFFGLYALSRRGHISVASKLLVA